MKHFCLLFTSLLFLGEIEVTASASPLDSRQSLHQQKSSQTVAPIDDLFSENGEERDIESRADSYVLTQNINLPQAALLKTYLFPEIPVLPSGHHTSSQNSRAPPTL